MNARVAVRALLALAATVIVGNALAQETECERIEARFGTAIYLPPCDFQGVTYEFCIDADTTGDLREVWHAYGTSDNLIVIENPWPNHAGIIAAWTVSSFETSNGKLWTQDMAGTHLDLPAVAGEWIFAQMSLVIGGTGKYEGATGWLGISGSEIDGGRIDGVLCTRDRD